SSGDLSQCLDPSAGCASFSVPLDVGLPGLSLHSDQQLSGGVGWSLHVALGLDSRGFFAEPGNKLKVGLGVTAPQDLEAMLSFLHVKVTDLSNGSTPAFSGIASVGLRNAQDTYVDDLVAQAPSLVNAGLSADAKADWRIQATAHS